MRNSICIMAKSCKVLIREIGWAPWSVLLLEQPAQMSKLRSSQ